MAIRIVCPHCQSDFKVADTVIGKKMRCKSCQEAFTAEEADEEPVSRKSAKDAVKAESNGQSRSSKTSVKADKSDPGRRKAAVDDEEEDDRPRKRRKDDDDEDDAADRKGRKSKAADKKKKGGAPVGLIIGLSVGGLVLLIVVGVVIFICMPPGEDPDIAQIRREKGDVAAEFAKAAKQANKDLAKAFGDNPPIKFGDPKNLPGPGEFPDPNKIFGGVDPKNLPGPGQNPDPNKIFGGVDPFTGKAEVTTVAEALKLLKGADLDDKKRAIRFLSKTEPNGPEQTEVAKELASLQGTNGVSVDTALVRWATAEQIPALLNAFEKANLPGDQRRKDILRTLGKLQDERGLDTIVGQLGDFFQGEAARAALDQYGDKAKTKLASYAFIKNGDTRKQVQTYLTKFNVPAGEIAAQALKDLNSPENDVKNAVFEWLDKTPVIAEQQAAISKALEGLLSTDATRRPAAKAMKNWATADAIPAMAASLAQPGDNDKDSLREALVRLKDPRAAEAVAKLLENGAEGDRAVDTLRKMGAEVAGKAVTPYAGHQDKRVSGRALKLLKEWGINPGTTVAVNPMNPNPANPNPVNPNPMNPNPPGPNPQPPAADMDALIKQVMDAQNPKRHDAMTALAKIKDPKAALAIATRMLEPGDKGHAHKLLVQMGSMAEPAVLQIFVPQHKNLWVDACHILKEIGTAQSLPLLTQVVKFDPRNMALKNAAVAAAQAIQARGGRPR